MLTITTEGLSFSGRWWKAVDSMDVTGSHKSNTKTKTKNGRISIVPLMGEITGDE